MGTSRRFQDARRTQRRTSAIQVLIFLLLTGTLTFFITVQIARIGFGGTYKVIAVFDDVSGLRKGDKVKIAGAPVGQVGDIRVSDGKARVELDVSTQYHVPRDSEAAVRWRDAITNRVVYLIPGTSPEMMHDGDHVTRTRSVVDLSDLINRLEPLAQGLDPDKLNQILTAIYTAVEGDDGSAGQLLANVDSLSSTIAARRQTLTTMLSDFATVTQVLARRDQQIVTATGNLATLTNAFADNTALVDQAISDLSTMLRTTDTVVGNNTDQLSAMLDKLTVIMAGTHRNLAPLRGILNTTGLKLADLARMFDLGQFVTGAVPCITLVPGPCPTAMKLSKLPDQATLDQVVVGGQ